MSNTGINHKDSQDTLGNSNDAVVVDITDKTINELNNSNKDEIKNIKDVN